MAQHDDKKFEHHSKNYHRFVNLNFLNYCRRLQGIPKDSVEQIWNIVESETGSSHSYESQMTMMNKNDLYSYALSCQAVRAHNQPYNWLDYVNLLIIPIILVIGLIGNILAGRVMWSLGQNRLAICLYAVILSVLDQIILLSRTIDLIYLTIQSTSATNIFLVQVKALCCAYPFFMSFLFHLRGSIHLIIAVDTFLLYWRPVKYWKNLTIERVRISLILLCAVYLTLNTHYLWTYELKSQTSDGDLMPQGVYCQYAMGWVQATWRNSIWPLIDYFIGELLPLIGCTIILLMTIHLIYKESKMQENEKRALHLNNAKYIIDIDTFYDLRKTFFSLTLFYLVLLSPQSILYISKYRVFLNMQEEYEKLDSSITAVKTYTYYWTDFQKRFLAADSVVLYMTFIYLSLKSLLYFSYSTKIKTMYRVVINCNQICACDKPSPIVNHRANHTPSLLYFLILAE